MTEKIDKIKKSIKERPEAKEDFSDDFYDDVDEKGKKKFFSVWIVVLILLLIFGLMVAGLLYLKQFVGTSFDFLNNKQDMVSVEQVGLVDLFQDNLEIVEVGSTASIVISESDLSSALAIESSSFPLKDATLDINQEAIEIFGNTSTGVMAMPVTVKAIPKVEEGELLIDITSISSGSVSLPKLIQDEINLYLDEYVNKKMSQINNFKFEEAALTDSEILITGEKLAV